MYTVQYSVYTAQVLYKCITISITVEIFINILCITMRKPEIEIILIERYIIELFIHKMCKVYMDPYI